MFEFTAAQKRKRVQAVLTARMNQRCLDGLGDDGRRVQDRSSYVTSLVVIPGKNRSWAFDEAFPVLTRDISPNGLSLVHAGSIEGEVLVVIPSDGAPSFLKCDVQNCNDMGYGYWQIGLAAQHVVDVEYPDQLRLDERLADFDREYADEVNADTAR